MLGLVESAVGIEASPAIAQARGTFGLAFGSGDYRRDAGAGPDDLAMAYPRSRLVVASRIGHLPGPIDGPTVEDDRAVLRERTTAAASMGMTGKLCLDTAQPAVINELLSPTASEIVWAGNFLTEFETRGRTIRDGSDRPRLAHAQKITELAAALGLGV